MRPSVRILGILCALLVAGSALLPWWNVIGAAQPHFVGLLRIAAACLGMLALLAFAAGRGMRPLGWISAALIAIPILLCLTLAVYDPSDMAAAVSQNNQAGRLVAVLSRLDVEPALPWVEQRGAFQSYPVIRNDYSLMDGLETAAFFARLGFYACLLGSLLLLVLMFRVRQMAGLKLVQRPYLTGALCAVFLGAYFAPMGIGHIFWHRSRKAESEGDIPSAIRLMKEAARWDPRLDYDFAYHFDLGRLYGQIGETNEPDYWATVADVYEAGSDLGAGQVAEGYRTYLTKVAPNANPTIAPRMANAFLRMGGLEFSHRRDRTALQIWKSAQAIDPSNLEIQWAVAAADTRMGLYEDALADWKNIIADNEGVGLFRNRLFVSMTYRKMITARAWTALAWCYYKTGDVRRANISHLNSRESGSAYLSLDEG